MLLAFVVMAGTTFAQMQRREAMKPVSKTELQKKGDADLLTFHVINLTTQQSTSASFLMSTVKNYMAAHDDTVFVQWETPISVTAGDQYIVYYDIDYTVADTFVVWNTYAEDENANATAVIWGSAGSDPTYFSDPAEDGYGEALIMSTGISNNEMTSILSEDENWRANLALEEFIYLDRLNEWYNNQTGYLYGKNSLNFAAAGEVFTAGATGLIFATEMMGHYATKIGGGDEPQGAAEFNLWTIDHNQQTKKTTSHDFGSITLGEKDSIVIALRNEGTATGKLISITFSDASGNFYTPATGPINMNISTDENDNFVTTYVKFEPKTVGVSNASITFVTSVGNLTMNFTGTGVQNGGPDAIANAKAANIAIYPNPAKEVLNISNAENAQISIYNLMGQEVRRVEKATALEVINVADLARGSYIVKIMNEGNVATQKFNVVR